MNTGSTSTKLVYYRPLMTRRLMPTVTVWTLNVCAGILSRSLSSWVAAGHTVGRYEVFAVATVIISSSLHECFSATVSIDWALRRSLLHSVLKHIASFEQKPFVRTRSMVWMSRKYVQHIQPWFHVKIKLFQRISDSSRRHRSTAVFF